LLRAFGARLEKLGAIGIFHPYQKPVGAGSPIALKDTQRLKNPPPPCARVIKPVGAGFTKNTGQKRTISKTRPYPTINPRADFSH
jgi:hypothetical protein